MQRLAEPGLDESKAGWAGQLRGEAGCAPRAPRQGRTHCLRAAILVSLGGVGGAAARAGGKVMNNTAVSQPSAVSTRRAPLPTPRPTPNSSCVLPTRASRDLPFHLSSPPKTSSAVLQTLGRTEALGLSPSLRTAESPPLSAGAEATGAQTPRPFQGGTVGKQGWGFGASRANVAPSVAPAAMLVPGTRHFTSLGTSVSSFVRLG